MEPVTLTAAAIATLVFTKAGEKVGEKLGEKVVEQTGKLMEVLKRKSPDTASAIEVVQKNPELAQKVPSEYSVKVLAEKIETLAQKDSEIREALQGITNEVNAQPQSIQSITNIAEKIGLVAPGSVFTGNTFNL
jgi:hypothetical protein